MFSAFVSAGQRCTCARKVIVPDNEAGQAFIDRLVQVAAGLIVGTPEQEPAPFMGPVVSAAVAQRLLAAQDRLIELGGRALLTMRQVQTGTG
ncbi:aldehyde dehydrogenase family protein, partial [Acinetobacter baumannii]